MARSPGMSQALARSPGLIVSTVLTCMIGALLPPLPGLTLFVGGLALTVVLCAGGPERPGVRLLGRSRALSEMEASALAPAIALLCQKGLGPPAVELYARDGEVGISAGAAGRRSLVVSAGLPKAAQLGQLPAAPGGWRETHWGWHCQQYSGKVQQRGHSSAMRRVP